MKHSFLFMAGVWTVQGTYYDQDQQAFAAEGRVEITHEKEVWRYQGRITLAGEQLVKINSNYEIAPFAGDVTGWQSDDAKLGTLIGQFAVVEDTIISLYSATSGEYFGSESWTQVSESQYRGQGVLYGVAGKIYSWSVGLEK